MIIELHGRITEAGTLEVTLPKGIAPGEVTVRIAPTPVDDRERPYQALVTRLLEEPPTEPWGNLADDADEGEYTHRQRRLPRWNTDDPEDNP